MYHPTRGGARGGAAEFSWDKVKESKDREFYLGNSVAAPTGRWQDGRDINWYNKDKKASTSDAAQERREELRKIKEAETAALYAKLGRPPPSAAGEAEMTVGERLASGSSGVGRREVTGANSAPLDASRSKWRKAGEDEMSEADKKLARKFAREETTDAAVTITIAARLDIQTMIATTSTPEGTIIADTAGTVEAEAGLPTRQVDTDVGITTKGDTDQEVLHRERTGSIEMATGGIIRSIRGIQTILERTEMADQRLYRLSS